MPIVLRNLPPGVLGGFSCTWDTIDPSLGVPAGPAIVIGAAALPRLSFTVAHEFGHSLDIGHTGKNDPLTPVATWPLMATCVNVLTDLPLVPNIRSDDAAHAATKYNGAVRVGNAGFEGTLFSWNYNPGSAALESNAAPGQGTQTVRLTSGANGWVQQDTRYTPVRTSTPMAAKFKGQVNAGVARFKTYYRHGTYAGAAPGCQQTPAHPWDLNNPNAVPAFQLYFSNDLPVTTAWQNTPAFYGLSTAIPAAGAGQNFTDIRIRVENQTASNLWVDSFYGAPLP